MTEPKPNQTLKARLKLGGLWSLGGHTVNVVLRLSVNLLLAHLLTPAIFGVASLGQTVVSALNMFSDIGMRPYLIQSPKAQEAHVSNTLWTLQISRGLMLAAATAAMALLLAALQAAGWITPERGYGNAQLPALLLALAVIPAIGGFESTRVAAAQRALAVGRMTRLGIYGQLAGGVTLLVSAYYLRSLWAIPLGGVTGILCITLLSHTLPDGLPNRFAWDRRVLGELMQFGRWIFLSSVIGFFVGNLDRVLLGAVTSASQLGIYSIASTAVSLVTEGLSRLMNDLAMPAFCEVFRDRPQDLQRVHYRFRRPFDLLCLLAAGGLCGSGVALISFMYDARYQDAGWMLEITAWTLFSTRYRVTGSLLLACGDSRSQFQLSLISIAGLLCFSLPGAWLFGTPGFLAGMVLGTLPANAWTLVLAHRRRLVNLREELLVLPAMPLGYVLGRAFSPLIDWLPRLHSV